MAGISPEKSCHWLTLLWWWWRLYLCGNRISGAPRHRRNLTHGLISTTRVATCSSSLNWECVVDAGWIASDFASPTLAPWPRRLDGVEVHKGPRNISQDKPNSLFDFRTVSYQ